VLWEGGANVFFEDTVDRWERWSKCGCVQGVIGTVGLKPKKTIKCSSAAIAREEKRSALGRILALSAEKGGETGLVKMTLQGLLVRRRRIVIGKNAPPLTATAPLAVHGLKKFGGNGAKAAPIPAGETEVQRSNANPSVASSGIQA